MSHVLVIDNYDSFTYNLVHALAKGGATVTVHRNDAIDRDGVLAEGPDAIVLSPGPGTPAEPRDFGVCAELVTEPVDIPMLGVCLGMQGMAHHTGAQVIPAPEVVHGEATRFAPRPHAIFDGLPEVLDVGRYHSLAVDAATLDAQWTPLGATEDGILMAMAHSARPWIGVQFHPESILTPHGQQLIDNFLKFAADARSPS